MVAREDLFKNLFFISIDSEMLCVKRKKIYQNYSDRLIALTINFLCQLRLIMKILKNGAIVGNLPRS